MTKGMIKKMESLPYMQKQILRQMAIDLNLSKCRTFYLIETNKKFREVWNFLNKKCEEAKTKTPAA